MPNILGVNPRDVRDLPPNSLSLEPSPGKERALSLVPSPPMSTWEAAYERVREFDPTYFPVLEHPYWSHGIAYIYEVPTDPEYQIRCWEASKSLPTPNTRDETYLIGLGWLKLEDKCAIFARPVGGNPDGTDDILQAWVRIVGKNSAVVVKVQRKLMGNREDRTKYHPPVTSGSHSRGGLPFEREPQISKQCRKGRCYQIACTVETGPYIFGPSVNLRMDQGTEEGRRNLIEAVQALALHSVQEMRFGLEDQPTWLDLLQDVATINNVPAVGDPANVFHPLYQINVSNALAWDSLILLRDTIGPSGDAHSDGFDEIVGFSVFLVHSDLADDTHPGFLFLIELRAFVKLDTGTSNRFNGLRCHGSTAPRVMSNRIPTDAEIRLVSIAYLSASVFRAVWRDQNGTPRPIPVAFAPTPLSHKNSSQFISLPHTAMQPPAARATFAKDGAQLMSPSAFATFIVAYIIRFIQFILGLSQATNVINVNVPVLVSAFSYKDEKDTMRPVALSGIMINNADQVHADLDSMTLKCGRMIPLSIALNRDPSLIRDMENEENGPENDLREQVQQEDGRAKKRKRVGKPVARVSGALTESISELASNILETRPRRISVPRSQLYLTSQAGSQFMQALSAHSLAQTHENLNVAFPLGLHLPINSRLPQPKSVSARLRILLNASTGLASADDAPEAIAQFLYLWPAIRASHSDMSTFHVYSTLLQYSIMLSTHQCWAWYSQVCAPRVKSIVEEILLSSDLMASSSSSHWLYPLAIAVCRHYRYAAHMEVCVESSILRADLPSRRATLPSYNKSMSIAKRQELCVTRTLDILASWLGFPQAPSVTASSRYHSNLWPSQGRFINCIIGSVGVEALCLPDTWKAFLGIGHHVFGLHKPIHAVSDINEDRWTFLESQLNQHPASQPDSQEKRLINDIYQFYAPFFPRAPDVLELDVVSNLFLDFLKRYIYSTFDQRFTQWVASNPDKYNAIREQAPSRQASTQPNGPFQHPLDRSSFFSGLLFRGVLFNSKVLIDQPAEWSARFDDLQDFEARAEGIPNHELCNVRAYGSAIGTMGKHNARAYWEYSNQWEAWLMEARDGEKVDFLKLRSFIQNCGHCFGPLLSYLLSIDYCYAGLAKEPTTEELADIAFEMQKGAYTAIARLGGIAHPCSKSAFREVFVGLYHRTSSKLSASEKEQLGWNVFVFEHALCKLTRAFSEHIWSPSFANAE